MIVAVSRNLLRRDAAELAGAVVVGRGHGHPKIEFVRRDLREHGVAVGNDLVDDLVELRPAAEIERVGNHFDGLATLPTRELERSDPDRQRVIGRGHDIG